MAKLLFFVALCVAATMATPSVTTMRARFALTRMTSHMKSVDGLGDLPKCAEALKNTVVASLEENLPAIADCTVDCVEEMIALEEEILASTEAAAVTVEAQVAAFVACGDDGACKIAAIQDLVGTIGKYYQDVQNIVSSHLNSLQGKFPEAAACAAGVVEKIGATIEGAAADFIACVTA